ncbi:hypothetical protein QV65_02635 [Rhodococcus erythropolis]|nr:hypothetical protein QV65_02635 [Rhodococcus erythropolis]
MNVAASPGTSIVIAAVPASSARTTLPSSMSFCSSSSEIGVAAPHATSGATPASDGAVAIDRTATGDPSEIGLEAQAIPGATAIPRTATDATTTPVRLARLPFTFNRVIVVLLDRTFSNSRRGRIRETRGYEANTADLLSVS